MGLFDLIFKPKKIKEAGGIFQTLTAYSPVFHSWGGELYESALVRAAINARATHISKLKAEVKGTAKPRLQTILKDRPNEWQTWSKFLYRLSTILDMQNTAFIVPVIDGRDEITGIYPLLPSRCEIVQYQGEPWLRYTFSTGERAAIEMGKCGIMTKFQYADDFFGEDNQALTPTMELINIQNQGIEEGVRNSAAFRFFAKLNNFAKEEDIAKEQKRFTKEHLRGEGGVLLFPNTYTEIQQIKSSPFIVDAEQMRVIENNVYNYFGVNEKILQNKAYGDEWSAFYEGVCEWFSIQFSEVVSRMIFSEKERSMGSSLMATANRLQYMSNREKLSVSAQMADRGIMKLDEIRDTWNLPPLPNGMGQVYPVRGEYYMLGEDGGVIKKGEEASNGNQ